MPRTPREIIDTDVRAKLRARALHRSKAELRVTGAHATTWTVDIAAATLTEGTGGGPPDCTITLSDADFVDIFEGRLRPAAAFWQRKVDIRGSVRAASELARQTVGHLWTRKA